MTKARPRPGEAGTGAVIAGSGQAGGLTAPVTPARGAAVVHWVVPAHLTCRIGAREQAGERSNFAAGLTVRAHLSLALLGRAGATGGAGNSA